ncbi:MAG TPA: rod shape-determining protein RodA [Gemmatimonadaceae bacterium]|nr:rod shape-determining protein RodA [Gemmatimonadaceae bacterium]
MGPRRLLADPALVVIALLLSLYGIAMVYSAGQTDVLTPAASAWRLQLQWLAVGLVAAFVVSRATMRFIEWAAVPAYFIMLVVLVAMLKLGGGAGPAASSKSWLIIAGHRLGQPSELAKVITVLMLARELARFREPPRSLFDLWRAVLIVMVPCVLILAEHDLGSAIVLVPVLFAMLWWIGTDWRLLVLLASPAVSLVLAFSTGLWGAWFLLFLAIVFWYRPYLVESTSLVLANLAMGVVAPKLWERLAPYRQHRLLNFIDPSFDPLRSGWHVMQSKVAIGSGGWLGKGYLGGTQKRLAFLPEQHTDFIFAVLGEELGFIGVLVALALFLLLLRRVVRIASSASEPVGSLVAVGLGAVWLVHIIVNIGMTLNLMPITGIPLPFFSYGGSFMVSSWISIGILARIASEGRGARTGEFAV